MVVCEVHLLRLQQISAQICADQNSDLRRSELSAQISAQIKTQIST